MKNTISSSRKAILAFLLPLAGAIGAAMQDGNLTVNEAVASVGLALVTGVAVYATPNKG